MPSIIIVLTIIAFIGIIKERVINKFDLIVYFYTHSYTYEKICIILPLQFHISSNLTQFAKKIS